MALRDAGASSITVAGEAYILRGAGTGLPDVLTWLQFVCDRSRFEKQHNCTTRPQLPGDDGVLLTIGRVKNDEGTLFLGDGSLAAAPTPKLNQRGLRSVIKVVDDRCLYAARAPVPAPLLT